MLDSERLALRTDGALIGVDAARTVRTKGEGVECSYWDVSGDRSYSTTHGADAATGADTYTSGPVVP